MRIGLDIDDTLIPYHTFSDSVYKQGCKELGLSYSEELDDSQYEVSGRYKVDKHNEILLEDWIFGVYKREQVIPRESVQFISELVRRNHALYIVTRRSKDGAPSTREQLAPVLEMLPELEIHYTRNNKSIIMFENNIELLLDDSTYVWNDVSSYSSLLMMSPMHGHNAANTAPKYKDFEQALEIIDRMAGVGKLDRKQILYEFHGYWNTDSMA